MWNLCMFLLSQRFSAYTRAQQHRRHLGFVIGGGHPRLAMSLSRRRSVILRSVSVYLSVSQKHCSTKLPFSMGDANKLLRILFSLAILWRRFNCDLFYCIVVCSPEPACLPDFMDNDDDDNQTKRIYTQLTSL